MLKDEGRKKTGYHPRMQPITGHVTSQHPLYSIYNNMKGRCYDELNVNYNNYGGRGIVVCDKWLWSFESFAVDMGNRPSMNYSLDRIDNDGNYEPSNCKWSTLKEQANNKRVYITSKTGYSGIRLTASGTYQVRTMGEGRTLLGCFLTLDEALIAQTNNTKQHAPRITNTTGIKGVTLNKHGSYVVRKVVGGVRLYLGSCSTLIEAKGIYDEN